MFYNPVKVIETYNWREDCRKNQELLGIQNPLIITSNGHIKRHELLSTFHSNSIFSDINPNPTFETCKQAIDFSKKEEFNGVIAIGGGSVMDTAKVVMASLGTHLIDINEDKRFDKFNWSKVESLLPGKDSIIDLICDKFFAGEDFILSDEIIDEIYVS
jgi:alcohol dehydrogenase class IV